MIRLASAADGESVSRIYAPVVAGTAISFEVDPPSPDEMAARIVSTLKVAPWLVWEREGEVVGYAYASRHRERAAYQWSVDVSVYIAEAHRRAGTGRALYRTLLALARLQGFCVAHAGITLPNAASVGFHESFGFRPIGVYPKVGYKAGGWRDVGWWQLPLRAFDLEPRPPRTPTEAERDPEWSRALGGAEEP